jgi:hypothetical protein
VTFRIFEREDPGIPADMLPLLQRQIQTDQRTKSNDRPLSSSEEANQHVRVLVGLHPASLIRMMAQDSGRDQHPIEIPNESSQAPSVRISNKWSDRFGIQVARVAGCMKRGLGLGRPTLTIMNAAAHSTVPSPSPSGGLEGGASLAQLGLLLQRAALGLFGDFVTTGPDGVSLVDYDAMRSSEAFAAYVSLTDKLRCIQMESPAAIGNKDEQLAFWLNLYVS